MTDEELKALVARLRNGIHITVSPDGLTNEAADAIETLMEELDAYKMDGSAASMAVKAAEARAERAEAALREAEEGLSVARDLSVEAVSDMGFTEEELPEFAFDYIDRPLAKIRAVFAQIGKETPNDAD